MIVCVCHRVSDRDIHRAAREGVASFDALQDETAVATGCGACLDCARETFADACCGAQATAAPRPAAPAARGAASSAWRPLSLQSLPAAALAR